MDLLSIIEKEISETQTAIAFQHEQVKWYLQTYLLAISGLFALSGYFASDSNITVRESIIGATFTITTFFLGWIFLSVIAHKSSLIIMLYKQLAVTRGIRARSTPELAADYVMPRASHHIKVAGMLKYLPYLFFVFNFLILCGGLSFYFSPHMKYFQIVASVSAFAVTLGTFYPVVCVTFNRQIRCATHAKSMRHKNLLERIWGHEMHKIKQRHRGVRGFFLAVAMFGAISIAIFSFSTIGVTYEQTIVYFAYIGTALFGVLRLLIERYRLVVALKKVDSGIE
ncbi:MAG TPA: hypothetical protein VFF26_10520 [Gallionella sp.]|nr:hypothetical protein [Gallionella sp.]